MQSREHLSLVLVEPEKHDESLLYWKKCTPEERVSAVEILREQYYAICGHRTTPRMSKELRIVDLTKY
jgi:hypothetical protein